MAESWINLENMKEVKKKPTGVKHWSRGSHRVFGDESNVKNYILEKVKLPELKINDITKVPSDYINLLSRFSFYGTKAHVKLIDIHDGDTLDVAFFYKVPNCINITVSSCRTELYPETVCCPVKSDKPQEILVRQRLRLLRLNAVELKNPGGQEAKDYLTSVLPEYFDVEFGENDSFGRSLAEILVDGVSINSMLLEYMHPVYGQIFPPYTKK